MENTISCTPEQYKEIGDRNYNQLLERVTKAEALLSEFVEVYAETPLTSAMIPRGYKLWRDYYEQTGAHMILTDHGWECGSAKESYEEMASAEELPLSCFIHDEVNAPEADNGAVSNDSQMIEANDTDTL